MKHKIFLFLLPVLAAAWLGSCHKDPGKTIIQGHVMAYGTAEPVEGASVYVLCETAGYFGGSKIELLDSLVTDENGYFHIEYPNQGLCGGIFLTAFKEGFFFKDNIDIHSGVNDLEIVLDPEAWLRLRTIPQNSGSSIIIAGSNFYGGSGFYVYGYEGDTSRIFNTKGNETKIIRWYSGYNYADLHQDSLFLPGLDTTTYTIHY